VSDDGRREAELEAALRDLARQWRAEIHYVATRFLQLLSSRGAVGAVAHLLAQQGVSSGFARLAEEGKLDLTVEYLILRREYGSLFTPEQRSVARRRLVERGVPRAHLPLEPY
jgi:spore maturation protein SpmB